MTTAEIWMICLSAIMAVGTIGSVIVALIALNRGSDTFISPQPLDVRVIEELHKQFALRADFIGHVKDNDKQRGIIHKRLDDAIADYNEKFQALPNEIVALLRNTGNLK